MARPDGSTRSVRSTAQISEHLSCRTNAREYSTLLTLAFLAVLVRGYDWQLPHQRLDLDWGKRPPEPRDGLMIQLRPA
jgi:hypothetical protein